MAIQKHQNQEDIRQLIDQYGMDAVYGLVRGLVRSNVFASSVSAAARFPELFADPPVGDQEREIPEAEDAVQTCPIENSSGQHLEGEVPGMWP